MVAASTHLITGSGHILLNAGTDVPDRMTAVVIGASRNAAAGVLAVLSNLGLGTAGGDGRSAVYVEDIASLAGKRALRRFTAPRLIIVSRDPVALIEEFGATERDPRLGVRRARQWIELVIFKIALKSKCPVLILSHGLAHGSLSEIAAVVGPFCGAGRMVGDLPRPASVDGPMTAPPPARRGIVSFGAGDRVCAEDAAARTIVIGGAPRSGTSMIAAVLHAAGLPLGDDLVPSTFENVRQNTLIKPSDHRTWVSGLKGSWKAAFANPRHFRLAWYGFDVSGIKALFAARRRDGPVWGFKRPGIGSFIRLGGLRLLHGPRLVVSLRDPIAIAARIALAHDLKADVALPLACWFLLDSMKTARSCSAPTLLVSHDISRKDLPGLFGRLLPFCGLGVDAGRYEEIAACVERSGATYRKDFATPIVGELLHVADDHLHGWIEVGWKRPVAVDILADDLRIASALADTALADGRLLFMVHLPPGQVTSSTRIRAVISSSQAELRNSGFTLAELHRF